VQKNLKRGTGREENLLKMDIPENLSSMPENMTRLQESLSRVPEQISRMPDNISRVPENFSRIPENYLQRIPENYSRISEKFGTPENIAVRSMLGLSSQESLPENLSRIPDREDMVRIPTKPDLQEFLPQVPEGRSRTPNSFDRTEFPHGMTSSTSPERNELPVHSLSEQNSRMSDRLGGLHAQQLITAGDENSSTPPPREKTVMLDETTGAEAERPVTPPEQVDFPGVPAAEGNPRSPEKLDLTETVHLPENMSGMPRCHIDCFEEDGYSPFLRLFISVNKQGVIDLVHILVQYGFIGKSSGGEFNVDVDYIKKQLDKKEKPAKKKLKKERYHDDDDQSFIDDEDPDDDFDSDEDYEDELEDEGGSYDEDVDMNGDDPLTYLDTDTYDALERAEKKLKKLKREKRGLDYGGSDTEVKHEPKEEFPTAPTFDFEKYLTQDQDDMDEDEDEEKYDTKSVFSNKGRRKGKKSNKDRVRCACPHCPETYWSKKYLRVHIDSVHRGIKHPCAECGFLATTKANLRIHNEKVHLGKVFECDQCPATYDCSSHLARHKRKVHEGRTYTCDREGCEHTANSKENLKNHIVSKHERLICEHCPKDFGRKHQLQEHVKAVHLGIKFPCYQCDYVASCEKNLQMHIESKHDNIRYSCEQCQVTYVSKKYLRIHIDSVHKGIKHPCTTCGFEASTKANLRLHRVKEHDEPEFNEFTGMPKPRKSYQKTEKIQCDMCEYETSRAYNLKKHKIRKHPDGSAEVLRCSECEYTTYFKSNLKFHEKSKHQGFRHMCDQCEYTAVHKHTLLKHIKTKHQQQDPEFKMESY